MSDIDCPYCGIAQEINHDDNYGYEEDISHEQQCGDCDKNLTFYTQISFNYYAYKADCLNGQPHKLKKVWSTASDIWPNWVRCEDCSYENRGDYAAGAKAELLTNNEER